jgi:hypothetical protein
VPIVAHRRRRIEHVGLDAPEAAQAFLHGAGDHEAALHPLEQVFIDAVDDGAARPLLEPALPRQVRAEHVPQVVVLAHAVVQPQHVIGMLHRVSREAQADHLVDLPLLVGELDVGAPRRQVRRALPAETILRRDHETGGVAFLAQGAHQLARHHQVAALGERRAGGHHRNRGHYFGST